MRYFLFIVTLTVSNLFLLYEAILMWGPWKMFYVILKCVLNLLYCKFSHFAPNSLAEGQSVGQPASRTDGRSAGQMNSEVVKLIPPVAPNWQMMLSLTHLSWLTGVRYGNKLLWKRGLGSTEKSLFKEYLIPFQKSWYLQTSFIIIGIFRRGQVKQVFSR